MMAAFGLGGWEIILILCVMIPVSLACLAFWVWMLIDCIRNKSLSDNERILWTLVIVFAHALGALINLLAGRKSSSNQNPG